MLDVFEHRFVGTALHEAVSLDLKYIPRADNGVEVLGEDFACHGALFETLQSRDACGRSTCKSLK
jgi:hypothetical protein